MKAKKELEKIVNKVLKGEIKLHELDEILGNSNIAVLVRRLSIEKMLNIQLPNIGFTTIDWNEVVGRNIENPIGAVQIPVGIAGPLKIHGNYAKGEFYIPLATSEGALVASVNRGCKAITLSGGAKVKILSDTMSRAPIFKTPSIDEALKLVKWVREHFNEVKVEAESTTRYGKLLRIDSFIIGNNVWLRFIYSTGDAMGMNMVTIATDKACKYIEEKLGFKCVSLSGNLCVDKKPSLMNMLFGRGKTVVAEAVIKENVVKEVLKTSPEDLVDVNLRKNLLGSARAGSLSFNAHYANIVAAIFVATGQDVAQVVESSMGYTWAEIVNNNDLYISVTLPSLEVGTVGGGTRLPTQRETLQILGVYGPGNPPGANAKKFAEIVAAVILAGELSLLAALSAGHLAEAHRRLGRGLSKKSKKQ